jgi:hypothetical protein
MTRREGGAGPPEKAKRRPRQGGAAQTKERDAGASSPKSQHPVQVVPFRRLAGRHRRGLLAIARARGMQRVQAVLGVLPEHGRTSLAAVLDGDFVGAIALLTVERDNAGGFLGHPLAFAAFWNGCPLVGVFELEADAREAEAVFCHTRRQALDQIALRETGARLQ